MEARHVLVQLLATLLVFSGEAEGFVRPPPGKLVMTPHAKSDSDPQQVHISMVGEHHIRVTFITDDKHVPSLVEYGKTAGKYDSSVTGESTSYRYFFYKSGKIHHVTIGPLEPSTVYYYRCGGGGDEFSFRTPPATLPVEFVVVGDLGQTEWTGGTLSQIKKVDYDILLLPGDLSYADTNQPLWDSFGRQVEPLASSRPWMVTEGNHEMEGFLFIEKFQAYNARWRIPYEQSHSKSNLYYSFDVANGAVHVIMLGSYTKFGAGSEQYKWLEEDLRRVDRRRTAWVVALVHAPWYSTNDAHQGEGEGMRKAMEELLFKARVDVVFAGHVHAYQRFTRIYNNTENLCGPVYITVGDGGNREGLARNFNKNHNSAPLSLFQEASFGHGRLRVFNRTHAHWSWHRNDDSISSVGDEVVLESLSSLGSCFSNNNISPPQGNARDEL